MAYCPRRARMPTLALLALDTRFASLLRNSREPMLAQMRFAWWRETLASEPSGWPEGEPLLGALRSWSGRLDALRGLAEGWELLTGPAPLPREAMHNFAQARGEAFAALCDLLGRDDVAGMAASQARAWAIADLSTRLSDPVECETAVSLLEAQDWAKAELPRMMRPLAVLHGLVERDVRGTAPKQGAGLLTMLAAIRLGLLGR